MDTPAVFRLTRFALVVAAALAGIAMFLYPGGTLLDPGARGYSFFQNSMSDLGSTVAWNGQRNSGAPFHVAATVIFVLAGCGCFGALIRVYSSLSSTRWLVRTAGAVVLVGGAGLVGAALTPPDRYLALHGKFSLLAVLSLPMATGLLTLATALDRRWRRRVPIYWVVLTAMVMVWVSVMLSLQPATGWELAIPVILQKAVGFALVATLIAQSYETEHVATGNASARKAV